MPLIVESKTKELDLNHDERLAFLAGVTYELGRRWQGKTAKTLARRMENHFAREGADRRITLRDWERKHVLRAIRLSDQRGELELPKETVSHLKDIFNEKGEIWIYEGITEFRMDGDTVDIMDGPLQGTWTQEQLEAEMRKRGVRFPKG